MTEADLPAGPSIHDALGIRVVEATADRVVCEVDVGPRVAQPLGLLHGGASAVLAESAASIGAGLSSAPGHHAVGVELNISHLSSRRDGLVRAVATPIRRGRRLHVWSVDIADGAGEPVAVARCTIAIRKASGQGAATDSE